jgi:Mn2+/Fe2+ NRAMP family transporter
MLIPGSKRILSSFREIGPAAIVTAAFIGPGTLTTCTLAGASWGYALLWGLLFSIIATIILQEMASRLGIIGQTGLGNAIADSFRNPILKAGAVTMVIMAIGMGNAAYETGNITGASLGLESITGISTVYAGNRAMRVWPLIIGVMAFILLFRGSYKSLERILISLVILMSITFITTAIMVKPSLTGIIKGLLLPSLPKGSALTLISLIGTTVVPYNLFLHASAAREKWKSRNDLGKSRFDSIIAIGLGGIISSAIVITSSAAFFGTGQEISGAADLATQLEPLLGKVSGYFMAMGIFSAGISSAITAPVAAAWAISGVLRWETDMKDRKFRLIWLMVLLTGVIFATFGLKPVRMILMAQFANGLLLPVLAIFLLKAMNNREILGDFRNGPVHNLVGILIILITFLLGLKSIGTVTGMF